MKEDDAIAALAEKGRAREQRRRAAGAAAVAGADEDQARLARISTTWLGWFTTYVGGLVIVLGSLVGWGALLIVPFLGRAHASEAEGWLRVLAPFVLAVADLLLVRWAVGRWSHVSYRRALAWACALPFPLAGLEEMLAASPPTVGVITVRLRGAADLETIASAVSGLGRRWVTAQVAGDAVVVTHGCLGLRDDAGPQPADTNHSYLRFVRWLCDRLLLTVHAATPIAAVELGARRGA